MASRSSQTKKSSRKRVINADEKEGVIKKRLTEFYTAELASEPSLKPMLYTESMTFLGAGAFGQVFQVTARRDIKFGEFESLTVALTRDENHDYLNRVEPLKHQNQSDVAVKRGCSLAIKCETAFNIQLENLPINIKCLPEADIVRFSLYKEYNTLSRLINRYGYSNIRGFTKPYAFGRLGSYSFLHYEGSIKTTLYGFHILLLELCGPDIEDMLEICSHNCRQNDQRMSTRTVFMIGDQFISRLQCLQEPSIALSHNDLKCDQLMVGRWENTNTIYLIDYGLVTRYKETWNSNTPVTPLGNRRWAPRSNHQMVSRTPLCEIESACYVLLRLLKNHFPWDGMFDRQMIKMLEMKEKGVDDLSFKSGDLVLYEEKQFLWMYLKRESGRKDLRVNDDIEEEIEKYKDFFEERNDKWGDGGSQILELMVDMVKLADPLYCSFTDKKIDYADINYMGIRKHLLNIFDLSMYDHCVESAAMTGTQRQHTETFFRQNRERKEQRTECGRPVYHYFPEGEQHVYWEWHCRCKDIWENRPEYWHRVLANREELAALLQNRQEGGKKPIAEDSDCPTRVLGALSGPGKRL